MFPIRGFIRNHRKLTALLLLASPLWGFAGWQVAAPIRGSLAASFDVMRGHYQILSVGLPSAERPEYARLLRERYGIELRVMAGCSVSGPLDAYVDGYNKVSMAAANRKFERDVFRESAAEAIRNWRLGQPTARLNGPRDRRESGAREQRTQREQNARASTDFRNHV